ncbi:MAG: methylmalonyl-CoA mutase, partial [Deltaproteobacteria bacterium]|nr:methylmalonyl-CoA mutase [Deltaproteobacteria bacterium]
GQTSGVDLTRQQPLNNIARVTTQAIVGILSGLQSMHTDAYDEAISCPTEEAARIAVNTQNILREEAHLCDVIDPLGGSYYIESLTDQMEVEINSVIEKIDAAGGMFKAVESGLVQAMIGESALSFQRQIESGDQKLVGVNCYQLDEDQEVEPAPYRPNPDAVKALAESFKEYKAARSKSTVQRAIDNLARAANSENDNLFEQVVTAAEKGVTHGEIVACLRRELGEGKPIIKA